MQFNCKLTITLLSYLLSTTLVFADLTDMVSEASCVARCFQLFTASLVGEDKQFLSNRPDLTQPHCINRKSDCALVHLGKQSSIAQYNTKAMADPMKTCETACQFANHVYKRSSSTSSSYDLSSSPSAPTNLACPSDRSWTSSCSHRCQSDPDCVDWPSSKCCHSLACSTPSSVGDNRTKVCVQGIYTEGVTPPIPGQPLAKQTNLGNQQVVELDWSTYYTDDDLTSRYDQNSNRTRKWRLTDAPVVFLIQLRLFEDASGRVNLTADRRSREETRNRLFSNWHDLYWTTKLGAELKGLAHGTWYQFRLLAVSPGGHGGWGRPSDPLFIINDPVEPPMPGNLTGTKSRLFDKHVDLTIQWDHPSGVKNLIEKYKINWQQYFSSNGDMTTTYTQYQANVTMDQNIYTIQNLKPGTPYKIQVTGVAKHGATELTSRPATIFVTTTSRPNSSPDTSRDQSEDSENTDALQSDVCRCRESKPQSPVQFGAPYYSDNQLKISMSFNPNSVTANHRPDSVYKIEWNPRVCIESTTTSNSAYFAPQSQIIHGRELAKFVLSGLQFQCHYKLLVQRLAKAHESQTESDNWIDCFCTPACQEVPIERGKGPENCSPISVNDRLDKLEVTYSLRRYKSASARQDDQSSIRNLSRHSRTVSSEAFDALIAWNSLTGQRSPLRRSRYRSVRQHGNNNARGIRITWGPRVYEPIDLVAYKQGIRPHMDADRAQSKVLSPEASKFLLRDLEDDTVYIVDVQMIGFNNDGPITSIYFATPVSHSSAQSHKMTGEAGQLRQSNSLIWLLLTSIAWVNWDP